MGSGVWWGLCGVVGGSDGAMVGGGSLEGSSTGPGVPEPSESIGSEIRMTAMRASPFVRTSFICAVAR